MKDLKSKKIIERAIRFIKENANKDSQRLGSAIIEELKLVENFADIKIHYLKTETEYYQAVKRGEKLFELRKNDRDFRIGDFIYLEETVNGVKTGKYLEPKKIKYILKNCRKYGLKKGYCILNW